MRFCSLTFFCFIFVVSGYLCQAQKQLVFLQKGNVFGRFTEGDYFKFKLKDQRLVEGYITELTDFTLITAALDTIPFQRIAKFSLRNQKNRSFTKTLGRALLIGGIGYIAIDQLNVLIGTNKSGFDEANQRALGVAAVGGVLTLIKPKYKRVARGLSIRTINYSSPYYQFNR